MERTVDVHHGFWHRQRVMPTPMTQSSDDARLVFGARDGDRGAFGLLYERYARLVHGILLARVPRKDAEDLVQDTFLIALRRLHTLRETGAFGSWIATIARNLANDYHRRTTEVTELPEEIQGEDRQEAEAGRVLAAIKALPEAYRETLMLRLVEGMTGPEIAERTGLTAASVRVNLHRGMKQLRERLEGRNAHDR